MRVGIWVLAAAIAVSTAACERDAAEEGQLTATQNMLTDEQVERALGPETQGEPGNRAANLAISPEAGEEPQ